VDDVVFLFDVDNTLLDNDRVSADLDAWLREHVGDDRRREYRAIFEELRAELGYADYLGALQRFRARHPHTPSILRASSFLVDYPFANRLYPGSLDALAHVARRGPTAILSDGDVVFQPRKVERSGLWSEVDGRVLIYTHKERELADVKHRFPARHYVVVDDKLRILDAIKGRWGERCTTVFVRQGHYATDPVHTAFPPADVTLERVGALTDHDPDALRETTT